MGKFVIFQFLNGSFEQGFPVRVRIGEDGASHSIESSGSLPPAPEIIQNYRRWQDIYFNLGFYLGLPFRLEAPAAQVTNYSIQDCNNAAQLVRHSLNNWLKYESFISPRERVLLTLKADKAIELAKANQGQLKLLGSPSLYTSQTLESGKGSVNGMVLAVPWYPGAIPGNSFPSNSAKLWGGSVNWRTATAYDATHAIITGLEKSNSTREGLQKVLSSNWFSVNGATGNIQFLPSGDRVGEGFLVQVKPTTQPGKYQFIPLK